MTQPPNTRGDVKHGLETNDRLVGMKTKREYAYICAGCGKVLWFVSRKPYIKTGCDSVSGYAILARLYQKNGKPISRDAT